MGRMARATIQLRGWIGGPGINTIYVRGFAGADPDIPNFIDGLEAAYTVAKGSLVNGMTIDLLPEIALVEDTNGEVATYISVTPFSIPVINSDPSTVSRATMLKTQFRTGDTVRNRQVRGGVYIGPINGFQVDVNGQVPPDVKAVYGTWMDGLMDDNGEARLVVWNRPLKDAAGEVVEDGKACDVIATSCASVPGVLRSRRD